MLGNSRRTSARHAATATADPGAPRHTSRRWFLAGGIAVVTGAAAGVGADLWHHDPPPPLPKPPRLLLAAASAERTLIADLDATTGGSAPTRRIIAAARADHAAHLAVLEELLSSYRAPEQPPVSPRGTARTLAQLRAAEQDAGVAAARRGRDSSGRRAALFASIAACEASHAELLQ